jgi:chromosome segregation ATPase
MLKGVTIFLFWEGRVAIMSIPEQSPTEAQFTIENIGGIDETEVEIPPGVTVLSGKNATNRTSFLYAIMAAMGSNQATLKGDADQGRVEMTLGSETVERTLRRSGDDIRFSGDGYLDEPGVAELFSFLHEMNEARHAVTRGDDLREVIMRPVDVDAIKREIERLEEKKSDINDELATIESRKQRLPELERRRSSIRDEIEDKRDELAAKEDEIDDSERDIKESREFQAELEEKFDELRSVRSELESVRRDIQSQEESISSLEQERVDLETELEELPDTPMGDHQRFEGKINRLRNQRQSLNEEISDLQSTIQYNKERLDEGDYQLLDESSQGDDSDSSEPITEQILADSESIICWTCGSTVDRSQIESTIDQLEDLREEKVNQLNEIKDDLEKLKQQQNEAEQKQHRRKTVERKLTEIEEEIDRREDRLASLKDRRDDLTDEVERYRDEVDDLESTDFDDVLELHKEANQLEFEIDDLESELEEVVEEIEETEALVEKAETLREEREGILEDLEDERTKIDQTEQNAIEEFNDHMDAILDLLEYDNLERIWIERVRRNVRDGRRKVEKSVFELHVVRTTENGTAYEDTIDHLSESEREVTGLIFALAGYLVHELYEEAPFMLLDSLEAIDSERIAQLVDYFAEYANFLVVALLPEDAQALDDQQVHRINSI